MSNPKILILGHARHGKDTAAEMIASRLGLSFESSSIFACQKAIMPVLAPKYGYSSPLEAYQDRHEHRAEWFDLIKDYNSKDKAMLARELLAEHDIYVGMRNIEEYKECIRQGLFTWVIWVDAKERKPLESGSSMSINLDRSKMFVIDNNTTIDRLEYQCELFCDYVEGYVNG